MTSPLLQICRIAKILFQKRLLDIAGGNISCRLGDQIAITPTGAGQRYLWDLSPDDLVCAPLENDDLLSDPRHSQESISHLYVYRAYPQVGAIIHAHPFHVMPFCAAVAPIPAQYMAAELYAEEFTHIPASPLYSVQQAEDLVAHLQPFGQVMGVKAGVALMPRHGIFIAGRDLLTAADCLERMDTNAYTTLARHWISPAA